MRTPIRSLVMLGCLASVPKCIAAVLQVPGDHATIQGALNAALDGDEIVVQPGIYAEMIDTLGKRVTLRSAAGSETTIIQAVGNGPVVRCISGEGTDTIVEGFTITGADSGQGSFYIASSHPTVRWCIIADNSGNQGTGMLLSASESLVQHCVFARNSSGVGSHGGGMAIIDAGHPVIEDCIFEDNIAASGGGGLAVSPTANPTIRRCTFRNNQAGQAGSAGAGGGLLVDFNAAATVIECVFEWNTASPSLGGGGVRCSGQADYTDCAFRDNSPNGMEKQQHGVFTRCLFEGNVIGILVSGNVSAPQLFDCTFIDNGGHGFETDTAFPTLIRCEARANGSAGFRSHRSGTVLVDCISSDNDGPGLWSTQSGSAPEIFERVTNGLFVNNGDAGVLTTRSRAMLTNCTVADNAGPGFAINVGIPGVGELVPTLRNGVIWGNGLGTFAGNPPIASHCLAQGPLVGNSNMVADPLFADSTAGNYQLSEGSPAIDSGDDSALPPGTLTDLAGLPRIVDGDLDGTATVDRGAFEFQPVIVAAMDIRPGVCPNVLNRSSKGVLPVALAGDSRLDVKHVDISTLRLARTDGVGGQVAPNEGPPGPHTQVADVATPFFGEACDCHTLLGDGISDLDMRFRTADLVAALELDALPAGAVVSLTLSGLLTDGTPFTAVDCVRLVPATRGAGRNQWPGVSSMSN